VNGRKAKSPSVTEIVNQIVVSFLLPACCDDWILDEWRK
jgi:hypothetical protein